MSELQVLENEVKEVVQEVVDKVEEVVKAATVDITDTEKLLLRNAELEYLKAQAQIRDLTKLTEDTAKKYQAAVEGFLVKYGLSKAEYIFDGAALLFKKL